MSLGDVVLFDLDGTLLDHDRAESDAIVDWAVTEGWPSHIDGVDVVSVWHQVTEDTFTDYGAGNLTFQGQRRARVRRLLSTIGDERSTLGDDEIDDLFEDFRARYEASWIAFPDVVPCVQAVCMKYRVAVLSNGDLSEKVAKVKAIGLAPYVEVTVASSDLGFPNLILERSRVRRGCWGLMLAMLSTLETGSIWTFAPQRLRASRAFGLIAKATRSVFAVSM
jgi:putative hydrolase of the HAD superfamily